MDDWVNPRGRVAKDYERVGKRTAHLILLCGLWLQYCHGDIDLARSTEPHELPASFPDSKAIKQAIKGSGAWEGNPESGNLKFRQLKSGRMSIKRRNLDVTDPMSIPAADFAPRYKWHWPDVFDAWLSGSLERSLDDLCGFVPVANREAIQQEMLA